MSSFKDFSVNRNHKDTLFRFLFGSSKESALSLYNALNRTAYTSTDDLEITTLDDVIYMKQKNDVSVLIGSTLSLYEQQSTFNPNMPLRGFFYFADLYRKLIQVTERLYSRKLLGGYCTFVEKVRKTNCFMTVQRKLLIRLWSIVLKTEYWKHFFPSTGGRSLTCV